MVTPSFRYIYKKIKHELLVNVQQNLLLRTEFAELIIYWYKNLPQTLEVSLSQTYF